MVFTLCILLWLRLFLLKHTMYKVLFGVDILDYLEE